MKALPLASALLLGKWNFKINRRFRVAEGEIGTTRGVALIKLIGVQLFHCIGNYKRPKLFGHPRNPSQPPSNKGRRIVSPFEKRGIKGDFWGVPFRSLRIDPFFLRKSAS
jgi:hypothetical protein